MTASVKRDVWVGRGAGSERARVRLFCFPYAGAAGSIFRTWPAKVPPSVEVCPVHLPGRAHRIGERPYDRLTPLVEALAAALASELEIMSGEAR